MDTVTKGRYARAIFHDDGKRMGVLSAVPDSVMKEHDDAQVMNQAFGGPARIDDWVVVRFARMQEEIDELRSAAGMETRPPARKRKAVV